jgi:hypothetical protein
MSITSFLLQVWKYVPAGLPFHAGKFVPVSHQKEIEAPPVYLHALVKPYAEAVQAALALH